LAAFSWGIAFGKNGVWAIDHSNYCVSIFDNKDQLIKDLGAMELAVSIGFNLMPITTCI